MTHQEIITLNVEQLSTRVLDTGGTGETVLFLHGWAAPIDAYKRVFDHLRGKYRIVAFDMPGVGGTEEPKRAFTLDDYVRFTLSLCEQMEIKEAIIMCHSHGGRIACRLLADPDCPVQCKRAVFMDATGVPPRRSFGFKLRQAGYKAMKALASTKLLRPLFEKKYLEMREKRSSADYKAASPVMRETLVNVVREDLRPCMPQIKAAVLLIWGEFDTATTLDQGREMERLIPGAGLAVIQGAGHFPFVENWPQFSAVLNAFL